MGRKSASFAQVDVVQKKFTKISGAVPGNVVRSLVVQYLKDNHQIDIRSEDLVDDLEMDTYDHDIQRFNGFTFLVDKEEEVPQS